MKYFLKNTYFKDDLAIHVLLGDITKVPVDCIVNAANTSLRGGGGVDGAIHKAGGPEILAECIKNYPNGCNTGDALLTTAGNLPAKFIIHTPGPIYSDGKQNEPLMLELCYKNSLTAANDQKCSSIAFPSISTGVYGYPIAEASRIAISTILKEISRTKIKEITFVLFSESDYRIYNKTVQQILT